MISKVGGDASRGSHRVVAPSMNDADNTSLYSFQPVMKEEEQKTVLY